MARVMETALYYNPGTPELAKDVSAMKGVMVRMGIRIRNVAPEQVLETVGFLAGVDGYSSLGSAETDRERLREADRSQETDRGELPVIPEQVLVLKQFSGSRLDELLMNLRKAGVPKIRLKAVLTEHNSGWTFYKLYQELKEEHEAMTAGKES